MGINTTNPDAQLDIRSSNQANPSNTDGILIPKIDFFPAVNPGFNQNGMMVFLTNTVGTNTPGFYYWEAATNNWVKILSGNSGAGNLDDAYNFGGPGQGKEIIANFGPLTISGNDGILSSGNLGSGSIGFVGTGEKMFWSPSRAAFRAGSINSFQWEIFNVGTYSFSFGRNNLALGDFSAVWGDSNEANQIHSTLWGEGNISNGSHGTVFGRFNNQSGINSTVWGLANVVAATNSTVYGQNNVVDGDKNSVWGERNNLTSDKNTVWGEENTITGDKSTVWGDFNQITSNQTTVWGENNQAQSLLSTLWGRSNNSTCVGCTAWGSFNNVTSFSAPNFEDNTIFGSQNNIEFGRYSTAWGLGNYAQSKASTVFGISNFARSIGETVLGIGATDYSPNGGAFSEEFGASFGTDRLLVVGNALDLNNNNLVEDNERRDALVILKNGNTGIGESSPQETLHVNGKIRMADGFQGAGKMLVGDANGTLSWQDNSAWSITGNSGLNNSTHYLGTNDNTDIIFKRNFMVSGLIGQTNTLFGVNSFSLSPTGQSNSIYGASSFDINANVNENTAVGFGTMSGHSSGNRNTALGANSFQSSSGSQESTAIGYNANVNSNLNSTALGANSYAQNPNSVILGSVAGVNGALNSVNVGVGTVTPEERFHVVGNIRMVDGNQAAGRVLTSDANGTATWQNVSSNSWELTGNNGTNSATNFIGTTDNQDVVFRRNNLVSGRIGTSNSSFGLNALVSNTGVNNVALGTFTLFSNTLGYENTAIGSSALRLNTTGFYNTSNGFQALRSNTIGDNNTSNGVFSLSNNTTGSNNTANGASSLNTNTTGSENTTLGSQSDVAFNNLTNASAIGARSEVGASNSLVLGSINGINGATSSVNVGIGTTTPQERLHVVGNLRMVDGNQANGRVLTSDANGSATWQNASANAWGLTGNAGTNPTTNFIGTTDNQDVVFRRSNVLAGKISASNTSFGASSLLLVTTGTSNSAFGAFALSDKTTGSFNSAFGRLALANSANGFSNSAFGYQSQANTTSGQSNSSFGELSLLNNTTGGFNTAVGRQSLTTNTTGGLNTTIGALSDVSINNLTNATAIGARAEVGASNSLVLGSINGVNGATANVNVGIGTTVPQRKLHVSNGSTGAISNVNTGILLESSTNVYQHFLSPNANESGLLFGSDVSSIHGGIIFQNNSQSIRFRTGGNINRMLITETGDVSIGPFFPGGQFELSLNEGRKPLSNFWTVTSDARLKIVNGIYEKGLSEIILLKPIRYNYKNSEKRTFEQKVINQEATGFLAQEVQQIFPEAVGTDRDGYLNFDLHPIMIASINAFKELNNKYEELKNKNEELEAKLNTLLSRIETLENK